MLDSSPKAMGSWPCRSTRANVIFFLPLRLRREWSGYYGGSFGSLFRFCGPLMDRVAIFVDAGYVFAQGSLLLSGKKLARGEVVLGHAAVISACAGFAEQVAGVKLLRV